MKAKLTKAGLVASLAVGVLLTGCATDAPQDTWQPEGYYAREIDNLQRPVFYVAGIVGVIVTAAVLYCVIKFRARAGEEVVPHQSHGNTKLEIGLTLLSTLTLVAIVPSSVGTLWRVTNKPDNAMNVTVIGQQWWWEYQYDGMNIVTANELVIPEKTKIRLRITSRDVIHSFWIPKLNGKRDAVPNRYHTLNLESDGTGVYDGQCTEFCGLSHANMRQKAVVLSDADFKVWVANQQQNAAQPPAATMAAKGEETFIAQCVRCHQVNGLQNANGEPLQSQADEQLVSGAAPNLTHLMSRTTFAGGTFNLKNEGCDATPPGTPTGTTLECLNRSQLEAWLRNAPEEKPMYAILNDDKKYRGMPNLNLTEQQIDELVAYLATLK